MFKRSLVIVMSLALGAVLPSLAAAQAPTIGIADGVFTVNGQKKFLLFFSYFGALRDSPEVIRSTFQQARAYGFDGVRTFPNWWWDGAGGPCGGGQYDPAPLFNANGTINGVTAAKLKTLLDIAYEEGLVVELALAHEPVQGITANMMGFVTGTQNLATGLRDSSYAGPAGFQVGYRHVFLDLQNEFNGGGAGGCKLALNAADIRVYLRDSVKAIDPQRLLTASIAYEAEPAEAWNLTVTANVDIIGYHDRRTPDWSEQSFNRVIALRQVSGDSRPIYFSETYPDSDAPPTWGPEKWWNAAKGAKSAGAAAWCWHTQALFRWPSLPGLTGREVQVVSQLQAQLNTVGWPR